MIDRNSGEQDGYGKSISRHEWNFFLKKEIDLEYGKEKKYMKKKPRLIKMCGYLEHDNQFTIFVLKLSQLLHVYIMIDCVSSSECHLLAPTKIDQLQDDRSYTALQVFQWDK